MKNVDLLGIGLLTTVEIKKSGREYTGLLFTKGDVRTSSFTDGSILLDIKDLKDGKIVAYHSAQLFKEESFDESKLAGNQYLIIEREVGFSRVLPTEDFGIE